MPGAGALPADLTAAAIREVDTPSAATMVRSRGSRGDVSDWLEQFAPVADPTEDEEEDGGSSTDGADAPSPNGAGDSAPSDADGPTEDLSLIHI